MQLRVSLVAIQKEKQLTPFKRAKQTHYDLRNESLKLKVKMFKTLSNTVEKYNIEITQPMQSITHTDLIALAKTHVQTLTF